MAPTDQPMCIRNGAITTFALLKRYAEGAQSRTRVIAATIPHQLAKQLLLALHWLIQSSQRNVMTPNASSVAGPAAAMKTPELPRSICDS
jgi:hypothetical protein